MRTAPLPAGDADGGAVFIAPPTRIWYNIHNHYRTKEKQIMSEKYPADLQTENSEKIPVKSRNSRRILLAAALLLIVVLTAAVVFLALRLSALEDRKPTLPAAQPTAQPTASPAAPPASMTDIPASTQTPENILPDDGRIHVTGQGYQDQTFTAALTLNSDGSVQTMELSFSGGAEVLQDPNTVLQFVEQYVGEEYAFEAYEPYDVITGATATSKLVHREIGRALMNLHPEEYVVSSYNQCGDFEYTLCSDGACIITDYTGNEVHVTIPAELDGHPVNMVRGLGDYKTDLLSITIPEGVTTIGPNAFYFYSSVQEIHLPESLVSIGQNAFGCCYDLQALHIPAGVRHIGSDAFICTDSLSSLTIAAENPIYRLENGFLLHPDGLLLHCFDVPEDGYVEVPQGIIAIAPSAFSSSKAVYVSLPDSIRSIGREAFKYCFDLASVNLPEGLVRIGDHAFDSCGMAAVHLPASLTQLGKCAFNSCESLAHISVAKDNPVYRVENGALISGDTLLLVPPAIDGYCYVVPDGITTIESFAFAHSKLSRILIPEGVTTIEEYGFFSCYELDSVYLPDTLTTIGSHAFRDCKGLKKLNIPASITVIPNSMCSSCRTLTRVDFAGDVSRIGSSAFYDCPALRVISFSGEAVTVDDLPSAATIYPNNTAPAHEDNGLVLSLFWVDDSLACNFYIDGTCSLNSYDAYASTYVVPEEVLGFPLTGIDVDAFEHQTLLTSITVPASVTRIDPGVFDHCPDAIVIVTEGSYAHQYCIDNSIPFTVQ